MCKYFTEESGQTCKWVACIFCRRKWMEASLELELCPKCLESLRSSPGNYEEVKLDRLISEGEFDDKNMA